jgi:hypothetical protein
MRVAGRLLQTRRAHAPAFHQFEAQLVRNSPFLEVPAHQESE